MIVHALLQGQETRERLELILSLTSIRPGPIRDALFSHYVDGMPAAAAVFTHDVAKQNFSRAQKTVNKVYSTTCAIHNIT